MINWNLYFSQTDVSALYSQLKAMQKKNTELEEENAKITSKVKIQIEYACAVLLFIYKSSGK